MLSKFLAKLGVSLLWLGIIWWWKPLNITVSPLNLDLFLFLFFIGVVLYLIEPALRKLAFLLNLLTLGIFNIALTVFLLWLVVSLFPGVIFPSIKSLLFGGALLWLLNSFERA